MPVEWELYLKDILPDVKGCPVTVAENAVRNAVIEFANNSRVWREAATPLDISLDNAGPYTIDVSNINAGQAVILSVHRAQITTQDRPLKSYPTQLRDDRWLATGRFLPRWFFCPTPDTIEFGPGVPQDDYTVDIDVVLKPTRDATDGPDFIYEDWYEEICHGAKARLKGMSGRPWTDMDMVAYHRREFIKGWNEARIRDAKSNVLGSSKTFPDTKFGRYNNSRYYR